MNAEAIPEEDRYHKQSDSLSVTVPQILHCGSSRQHGECQLLSYPKFYGFEKLKLAFIMNVTFILRLVADFCDPMMTFWKFNFMAFFHACAEFGARVMVNWKLLT